MWTAHRCSIEPRTIQIKLGVGGRFLTVREVIAALFENGKFCRFFTESIIQSSWEAFFFETPAASLETLDSAFECVLVEGGTLAGLTPDPGPFRPQFDARPSEPVLTFPNLGGDAVLVVPAPIAAPACYTHLARFLRTGPAEQIDVFWSSVGSAMEGRLSSKPVWLSTAGMGVSWLHLRLDSTPKYYRHGPYRAMRRASL